jgi:small-conductance mechanosensitive channel
MRNVNSNYGGVIVGAAATVLAACIGWLTARTTAHNQLSGTTVQSQASIRTAQLAADEAERKRVDDQTWQLVTELRKEVDRLTAQVQAQATRIDQLEGHNIRLRRVLEQHGLEVPKP